MANIGKEGLEIPNSPQKSGKTEISKGSQTSGLTPDQKMTLTQNIAIGVGIVSLIAMLGMLVGCFQFASNSFHEYSNTIKQYGEKRNEDLELRIMNLETKCSSQSAIKN